MAYFAWQPHKTPCFDLRESFSARPYVAMDTSDQSGQPVAYLPAVPSQDNTWLHQVYLCCYLLGSFGPRPGVEPA